MRKFVIIPIFIILCITTLFYTISTYLHVRQKQIQLYDDLEKTFLTQADTITQIFTGLGTQSAQLAKISDPTQIKAAFPANVRSIALFNSQREFTHGWKRGTQNALIDLPPTPFPSSTIHDHWVQINLDSTHHISYGDYLIEREDHSFLLITYDLLPAVAVIETLDIGYETITYTNSPTNLPTSSFSIFSRLSNAPIYLSKQVTPTWVFTFVAVWNDIYPFSSSDLLSLLITLTLCGLLLTFGTALLFHADLNHRKALWATTIVFDLLCISVIISVFLDFSNKFHALTAERLSYRKTQELLKNVPSAIFVPTMIYLESITFTSDSSFLVTGFIVQTYPKNASIEKGIVFPDNTPLHAPKIVEIDRWDTEGVEDSISILWQFGVTLSSSFNTALFPFDRRQLNIIIWPAESKATVIFIPHFSKYSSLFPLEKPGIGSHVEILGWHLNRSGFLIDPVPPYTFFHNSQSISFNFSVLLGRAFLDAFLSNFLPICLCIVFVFLVLFIPQNSVLESPFATTSLFVGILFIVVTNHKALREFLSASSFAYVEYIFVTFYTVLLILASYFIITLHKNAKTETVTLILALLYWPILLGSFSLILTSAFLLT